MCDLSLRLKECKLSAWRTAACKLFHTTARPQRKLCRQISSSYVEQSSPYSFDRSFIITQSYMKHSGITLVSEIGK